MGGTLGACALPGPLGGATAPRVPTSLAWEPGMLGGAFAPLAGSAGARPLACPRRRECALSELIRAHALLLSRALGLSLAVSLLSLAAHLFQDSGSFSPQGTLRRPGGDPGPCRRFSVLGSKPGRVKGASRRALGIQLGEQAVVVTAEFGANVRRLRGIHPGLGANESWRPGAQALPAGSSEPAATREVCVCGGCALSGKRPGVGFREAGALRVPPGLGKRKPECSRPVLQ